ncbi:MAG: aminotransferase class V-fold PLP-dependent enzyme [candidate division WOR-3 bacterium]
MTARQSAADLEPKLEKVRRLLPVTKERVYFNHAATGPLPLSAVKEMNKFCRRAANEGAVPYLEAEKVVEETRGLVAKLMGVKPEEIAFVKNTSSGIILAIGLIPWERDDNLIMMSDAFPANSYPYHLLLADVEKRFVTSVELASGPECIFRLVDKNTRAVALDWVHFLSGAKFDIATISDFCRKKGIYLIVDAIQGLGAIRENFEKIGADFVAAGGGKWLLAPQGIGVLYIKNKTLPSLKPFNLGWLSCHWEEFNSTFTPKPLKRSASKFEEGTKNYLGIYGLREALKLILEFGLAEITERVYHLTGLLQDKLMEFGFELLTPKERQLRAGIVTCRKSGMDMVKLQAQLEKEKFICSVRENWLRISPHFYNTEDEVERFVQQIKIFSE